MALGQSRLTLKLNVARSANTLRRKIRQSMLSVVISSSRENRRLFELKLPRLGEELGAKPDQASRRHHQLEHDESESLPLVNGAMGGRWKGPEKLLQVRVNFLR